MNLPNKLTILRILLIPFFVVFVTFKWIPGAYLIACAIFTAASITDYLDGHLARKHDLVTDFGKFADPLADKLLTTVAFLYMMMDGVCHPIVLVIILTREFAVSGVRMIAAGAPEGKVIAANMWGKVKTVMQMVVIITYYLLMGVWHILDGLIALPAWGGDAIVYLTIGLCWVVALVTAVSGMQYIWQNRQFINTTK